MSAGKFEIKFGIPPAQSRPGSMWAIMSSTVRSMIAPNRTKLKPRPSEKDSWYQCFYLLLSVLLVFSLAGFPQSSLCLCFPPLANCSSFPRRDRESYQPCWTNCLQRCPCCSWNDENYGSCTSEQEVHRFLLGFFFAADVLGPEYMS